MLIVIEVSKHAKKDKKAHVNKLRQTRYRMKLNLVSDADSASPCSTPASPRASTRSRRRISRRHRKEQKEEEEEEDVNIDSSQVSFIHCLPENSDCFE